MATTKAAEAREATRAADWRADALGRMGDYELAEFLMEEERNVRRAREDAAERRVFVGLDVY